MNQGPYGAPVIPPPPPRVARRRNWAGDVRFLIWLGAFATGVGLGAAAYQWTGIDFYFDYYVAFLLR